MDEEIVGEIEQPIKKENFQITHEDGSVEEMVRETFEDGETIEHSIHSEVIRYLNGGPQVDTPPMEPPVKQLSDNEVMMLAISDLYEEVSSLRQTLNYSLTH